MDGINSMSLYTFPEGFALFCAVPLSPLYASNLRQMEADIVHSVPGMSVWLFICTNPYEHVRIPYLCWFNRIINYLKSYRVQHPFVCLLAGIRLYSVSAIRRPLYHTSMLDRFLNKGEVVNLHARHISDYGIRWYHIGGIRWYHIESHYVVKSNSMTGSGKE